MTPLLAEHLDCLGSADGTGTDCQVRREIEEIAAERDQLHALCLVLVNRLANHCVCGGLPEEADGSCDSCTADLNALGEWWAIEGPSALQNDG